MIKKYPDNTDGPVFAKLFNNHIHLFCFSFTGKGFDWIKMDTSGKVLKSRKCTESISSPNYPSELQVFKNSTGLYKFYNRNDTIFQGDSTGYHPYRLLTREFSDGYNMVNEEWTDVFQFDGHRSNKPRRDLKSVLGIGDKWILQYQKINPGGRYREMETVLFDPADNTSYLVNSVGAKFGESVYFGLNNDWVGYGTIVPSKKIEVNEEKYISYVMDAIKLKKYVNSHEFASGEPKRPELKQQMQVSADNLTIDDNPVLILLKLKQ